MNFAILFKDIRRKENLTQNQFADKLNVSRSAIAQIESSKNNPSRDLMLNILEKFNLSSDLRKDLEEKTGVKNGKVVAMEGVIFNADELDNNKKKAYEMWGELGKNKDVLLSLCFALKELDNVIFTDEEIEKLSKVDEVIQYLFKILIPYENSNYINIDEEFLFKTHSVLENSNKYIREYTFKLSNLYKNKLRAFEDLIEYKNYKDRSEEFPF